MPSVQLCLKELKMNVLFIIYNRPDLTAKVFNSIRAAQPEKLFIVADGPKAEKASDALNCRLARLATENIDWPCEVKRLYKSSNSGCKNGVISGINWFFEHVEEGIILEDDCVPSQSFFDFCQYHLIVQKNNPEVGCITGSNFFASESNYNYSLNSNTNIWGWATWSHVWKMYHPDPYSTSTFNLQCIKGDLSDKIYWLRKFIEVHHNKIDTWDYQFQYLLWNNELKTVYPAKNLVQNIGFDERATHTKTFCVSVQKPQEMQYTPPLRADKHSETMLEKQILKLTQRNIFVNIVKLSASALIHNPLTYKKVAA
jgi:hypothetical protein